ncbi:MAG: PRC-barrel domain-containing protein [Xanthobacteraceae bacterium]
MRLQIGALGLAIVCASGLVGSAEGAHSAVLDQTFAVAQAMIPPTGMGPADKAMAAQDMAETARMQRRFPQPVRVGDLIGLPVLDDDSRTLGHVRRVVRTPQGKIRLIVAYGGFFGFGTRLVAVPIEVVGIFGRQLASLDMPRRDYAAAPTWRDTGDAAVPNDDSIRVALARR